MDTGIANAAIYYFEANTHLKKKEGAHWSLAEDIAQHLLDAKSIDFEGIYDPSCTIPCI
jgi:hypothetical protein